MHTATVNDTEAPNETDLKVEYLKYQALQQRTCAPGRDNMSAILCNLWKQVLEDRTFRSSRCVSQAELSLSPYEQCG